LSPPLKSTPGHLLALALSVVCWPALAQTSSALQAANPDAPSNGIPLALPPTGSAAPQDRPADLAQAREI